MPIHNVEAADATSLPEQLGPRPRPTQRRQNLAVQDLSRSQDRTWILSVTKFAWLLEPERPGRLHRLGAAGPESAKPAGRTLQTSQSTSTGPAKSHASWHDRRDSDT
eukprot:1872003-Rhodomonas_salina.1